MHRFLVCLFAALLAVSSAVAQPSSVATDVTHQIGALRAEIARHDELYHRQAASEIPDRDYDELRRRLAALERQHPEAARQAPPLPGIGDDRSGVRATRRHRERMLSLDKAYTETELRAFHARVARELGREAIDYGVEPK